METLNTFSLWTFSLCVNFVKGDCQGYSQEAPTKQIVALLGDDVVLPCFLKTPMDTSNLQLEWARTDLTPGFIYVWEKNKENVDDKQPSYVGRTSLSFDQLKHGDVSLTLFKVQLSDQGPYRCLIPQLGQRSCVHLIVGSASTPVIKVMSVVSSRVVLQCESAGWYPEPELLWLDGEGNLLSAGPTETLRGPDDLYTVSSRVTVEKRHSNNITCRVQQRNTNQSRETHMHGVILDSIIPPLHIVIIVGLFCFLAVWIVCFQSVKTKTACRDYCYRLRREGKHTTALNPVFCILQLDREDTDSEWSEHL